MSAISKKKDPSLRTHHPIVFIEEGGEVDIFQDILEGMDDELKKVDGVGIGLIQV